MLFKRACNACLTPIPFEHQLLTYRLLMTFHQITVALLCIFAQDQPVKHLIRCCSECRANMHHPVMSGGISYPALLDQLELLLSPLTQLRFGQMDATSYRQTTAF